MSIEKVMDLIDKLDNDLSNIYKEKPLITLKINNDLKRLKNYLGHVSSEFNKTVAKEPKELTSFLGVKLDDIKYLIKKSATDKTNLLTSEDGQNINEEENKLIKGFLSLEAKNLVISLLPHDVIEIGNKYGIEVDEKTEITVALIQEIKDAVIKSVDEEADRKRMLDERLKQEDDEPKEQTPKKTCKKAKK